MKKIKFGLIGCGKIVQASHAPDILKLGRRAAIVSLYDLNEAAAQGINSEFDLKAQVYADLNAVLKSGLDAVVISTPNTSHYSLTMKALKAGLHVLVEKPMAVSLKEADAMLKQAKLSKRVLQVNQSFRFLPEYTKIRKLVAGGAIGDPIHMRVLRAGGSTPDKSWSPGAGWFMQKKYRGGLVMDIGVHMLDMMSWILGPVAWLDSITRTRIETSDVPDNVATLLSFENGASGVMELSWTIPAGGIRVEIFGSKGTILMGLDDGGPKICRNGEDYKTFVIGAAKTSHAWFVDSIHGKPGCPATGDVGRNALALCLAVERSDRLGRRIKPETK